MRTEQEILDELGKLQALPQIAQPPAQVEINAPLALAQTEIDSKIAALLWALDY